MYKQVKKHSCCTVHCSLMDPENHIPTDNRELNPPSDYGHAQSSGKEVVGKGHGNGPGSLPPSDHVDTRYTILNM